MKAVPRFSPGFAADELRAAFGALSSGGVTQGDGATRFAEALTNYLGEGRALLTPSARMALWLVLRGADLEPGEIIFPGLTYYAMPAAAKLAGFTPRFVDVDEHLLLDLNQLENTINERTRAIVPTHLYGRVVDMPRLMKMAKKHKLLVVEDIAQGLGAAWQGRKAGAFGQAAIATFGPTKNITALGGACLFIHEQEWEQRLAHALQVSRPLPAGKTLFNLTYAGAMALACWRPLFAMTLGPLLKLLRPRGRDPIASATDDPPRDFDGVPASFFQGQVGHLMGRVGQASLAAMDGRNALRRRNGLRLSEALRDEADIVVPQPRPEEEPIYMSFPILVDRPDDFAAELIAYGIDTARGYMSSCARLPMFASSDPTPRADDAEARMLHLPVHPALSEAMVDEIAAAVRRALAVRRGVV